MSIPKRVWIEDYDCAGCGLCSNVCPQNAIEMKPDTQGFLYPQINDERCIHCGLCEHICTALKNQKRDVLSCYAVKNKKAEVLQESTSGGFFSALSEWFINNNGVVYGCILNEKLEAMHIRADNMTACKQMRDSKYVQSNIQAIYSQIIQDLDDGKIVLFTGTPCQNGAIHEYCYKSNNIENLYLCDIVCHGLASPMILKEHIRFLEKREKTKIEKLRFRDKTFGWNKDNKRWLKCIDENGKIILDDIYYRMYFNYNIISRPACASCSFTKRERIADFTMGDFWGIEKILPNFSYVDGATLLIIRSEKANQVFQRIKRNLIEMPADLQEAVKYNQRLESSSVFGENYEKIWDDLEKRGYEYVIEHYITPSITVRCLNKIKRLFRIR